LKIVLIGESGQVAKEIQKHADTSFELRALSRKELDLTDPKSCVSIISKFDADIIINAAAYTEVDKAEKEEELATLVNATSPKALAEYSALNNISLIHLSTDYVFGGRGKASWKPSDPAKPETAYGRSKLKGEEGVLSSNGNHVILRTSWIFSSHRLNFLKKIIELSNLRKEINVVSDQVGGPTHASDIAKTCLTIAKKLYADPKKRGIYHFSGKPDVSWANFAREVISLLDKKVTINNILSEDYKSEAVRPLNSRLDCNSLQEIYDIERPDWKVSLISALKELGEI